MSALAESDPTLRLRMLNVLISENDQEMSDFALAALDEIVADAAESPDGVEPNKLSHAFSLVEALASQKLFASAEQVVNKLNYANRGVAVRAITHLLENGYAGTDNQFLWLDFMPVLNNARSKQQRQPFAVSQYLNGLAAYGVGLFDARTPAGMLFAESMSLEPSQQKIDGRYNAVSYAYANGGRLSMAIRAKNWIGDPYWRSSACVQIAQAARFPSHTALVGGLLAEVRENIGSVANCDGSCGRFGCAPELDTRELEIRGALVLARQGRTDVARQLAGEPTAAFAYDQAAVYTQLYSITGDMGDRSLALAALKDSRSTLAGSLVSRIGRTDMRWNNVVPSLECDTESVPLICWELHGLYSQKSSKELQIEANGLSDAEYRAMELLGIDPATHLSDIAAQKAELRDRCMAELAKLTANTAPQTSLSLIDLIIEPIERVRALVGVAHATSASA